jgi:hypothetical protein
MRMKIISAFVIASLVACGGKSNPDPTTATKTEVAATGGIELGEITMFDGDDAMLKIHADGTTEVGGRSGEMKPDKDGKMSSDSLPIVFKPGPTIKADGSIEFQGEPVARINADGTIVGLKGKTEPLPIVVTADKVTVSEGGKQMGFELAADGKVTVFGGDKQPDKPIRVEGADTAGKRRLVLAFTSLMFLRMDPVPEPAEKSEAPAVAPAP